MPTKNPTATPAPQSAPPRSCGCTCGVCPQAEPADVDAVDLVEEELEETASPPHPGPEERRYLVAVWLLGKAIAAVEGKHGAACPCDLCGGLRCDADALRRLLRGAEQDIAGAEEVKDRWEYRRADRLKKNNKLVWLVLEVDAESGGVRSGFPTRAEAERERDRYRQQGKKAFVAAWPERFYQLASSKPWLFFDELYLQELY